MLFNATLGHFDANCKRYTSKDSYKHSLHMRDWLKNHVHQVHVLWQEGKLHKDNHACQIWAFLQKSEDNAYPCFMAHSLTYGSSFNMKCAWDNWSLICTNRRLLGLSYDNTIIRKTFSRHFLKWHWLTNTMPFTSGFGLDDIKHLKTPLH